MANDAVSDIRDRIDIVDLIQAYVPSLKKTGRTYKGLCPFHQEKTPSFVVFPDSQSFHCFGCGKSGDLFTFYMLSEHVEFRDALQELANRAGVTLDSHPVPAPEQDAHRHRLIEINELAATFFNHVLINSPMGRQGRELVAQRDISPEMVDAFRLGFAPDSWDALLNLFAARNIPGELAVEAGLAQTRESGGFYDRFRNRLMFPIRDREGHVVGFGGRALGDTPPKYLNSPQTEIFDKSSLVYSLDLAHDPIREAGEVVVVEGYMDAITAHQFGYRNVVASMGTALTEHQAAQLKRGATRIVLALDADAAGQAAIARGIESMRDALDTELQPVADSLGIIRFEQKLKTEIRVVSLPEGKDPDELIRKHPESWPQVVAASRPYMDFMIDVMTRTVDISDPRQKSDVIARIAPFLQQLSDRVVQGHYVSLIARRLDLDERVVLAEVRRAKIGGRSRSQRGAHPEEAPSKTGRTSTENALIALLLKHPDLTHDIARRLPLEEIGDTRNREIVRFLQSDDVDGLAADQIATGLEDHLADHAQELLDSLAGRPSQYPGQVQKEAADMLARLGRERFDFLMKQLDNTLRIAIQANNREEMEAVSEQIGKLAERHRQYYPPPSPYFLDTRSPQRS